jgi:hypothetical protein
MAFKLPTWAGITIAIIVYLIVGYINQFATENTIYYVIDQPPLYDSGHNVLPLVPKIYADMTVISIVSYFILRWGFLYPKTLENYLWLATILFIGRIAMFSVTQLPPPIPGCSSKKPDEPIHFQVMRTKWQECKDLIYSGHTFHTVLVLLFILYLSNSNLEKLIITVVSGIALVLIIASRIHYTVDVLLATLITILVFYAWPGVDKVINNIRVGGLYGITLSQTHNLRV